MFLPGIQSRFNSLKSISVIYHIYRLKKKIHIFISMYAEKAIDRAQYQFTIKTLRKKNGKQRNILILIKSIFKKPITHIIFNAKD